MSSAESLAPVSPVAPRPWARHALPLAVASVIAWAAAEAPERARSRPTRDDEVVALVPARGSREGRALEQLRSEAQRAPDDVTRAVALAERYIKAARSEGDPRYLGMAEGAIARFAAAAEPAPEVRLVRALVLEARHAFPEALRELDLVVRAKPDDAQAWLTRATVQTVRGEYAAARESCRALGPLADAAFSTLCQAPLDLLTGQAERARTALGAALARTRRPDQRALLHALAGEQAFWEGDLTRAEQQLREALALDPDDRYARAVLADVLLDAGRTGDVRALVSGRERDDALALRLALAAIAEGERDAAHVRDVSESFRASRLRGDALHQREEARLALALGQDDEALALARAGFAVQREPWDARVLLEAAVRAEQPEAARDALTWLAETQLPSPTMKTLARALRGGAR